MASSLPVPPKSSTISLVFTSPEGESVVHNLQLGTTRALLFQSTLPRPSVDFANRPMGRRLRAAGSNLSLRAIDTQREGDLAYQVVYQMEWPHMWAEALRLENDDFEPEAEEASVHETMPALIVDALTWFKALRTKLRRSNFE